MAKEEYPLAYKNIASSILSSNIDEQGVLLHSLGEEVAYAPDPDSNDAELRTKPHWYVKKDGNWTLLNKAGVSGKDFMNLGGEALMMLPGVGAVSRFARPLAKTAVLKYLARTKTGRAGVAGALTSLTEMGRQQGADVVAPEIEQMLDGIDEDRTVRTAVAAVGGSAGQLIGDVAWAMGRNLGKTQGEVAFVEAVQGTAGDTALLQLKKKMNRGEWNRNIEAWGDDLSSRIAASPMLDDAGLQKLQRDVMTYTEIPGVPKNAVDRVYENLKTMANRTGRIQGIKDGHEYRRRMAMLGGGETSPKDIATMIVKTSLGVPPVREGVSMLTSGARRMYQKHKARRSAKDLKGKMDFSDVQRAKQFERKMPMGRTATMGAPAAGGIDYGSTEIANYLFGGS